MVYLFDEWNALKERLRKRPLFIFLDFDGTLAPIAKTPAQAVIPRKTKKLLVQLSRKARIKIAIISGRSLDDIKRKLGLSRIIYSGNHGLEVDGPKIKFTPLISQGYKAALKGIKNTLLKKLRSVKGFLIEDKGFSLSLHYRLVSDKKAPFVKKAFRETLAAYLRGRRVEVGMGKKVLEVRPPLKWDKGRVVLWLLKKRALIRSSKRPLPVYIGDDKSDEDAFRALKNRGITIFVGRPKVKSQAKYYLEDSRDVARLLRSISRGTK